MKLGTYLTNRKMTHSAFAETIDVSQATVTRYVNGERMPDMRMIAKIHDATKGKVRVSDWYSQAVEAIQ